MSKFTSRNRTVMVGQRWRFGVGGMGELARRCYYTRTITRISYWREAGCWMASFDRPLPMPFKSSQWIEHIARGKLAARGANKGKE